jgi:hypothetical protein
MRKSILLRMLPLLLLAVPLVGGCGPDREIVPYLGKWTGGFQFENPGPEAADEEMRGNLILYAAKQRFRMNLEGAQQAIDIKGTWELGEDRVVLKVEEVFLDDGGGEDRRDPRLPYLPSPELRKTYTSPVVLLVGTDGKTLQSLPNTLAGRTVVHRFEKGSG